MTEQPEFSMLDVVALRRRWMFRGCERCVFLGHYLEYDLTLCPAEGSVMLILTEEPLGTEGDRQPRTREWFLDHFVADPMTAAIDARDRAALHVAHLRATRRGLIR